MQDRPLAPAVDPTTKAVDCMGKKIWEVECKIFGDQKVQYHKNMSDAYHLLWGQCTDAMQAKIKEIHSEWHISTSMLEGCHTESDRF